MQAGLRTVYWENLKLKTRNNIDYSDTIHTVRRKYASGCKDVFRINKYNLWS